MTLPPVRRVLIVEDSVEDTVLLHLAFEDAAPEIAVEAVRDGRSALAHCLSASAPQLVILDLHLPGETAWEVLSQLRLPARAPLKVVCWSSSAHPAEVEAVLDQGAVAYLEKPRGVVGFSQMVQTLLRL